jgi:RsiW-degrading membrane proteinase PrsW (M82 family)
LISGAPLEVVAAAVVPAAAYAVLVVVFLRPAERPALLVGLFLWGAAIAAPAAERANALLGASTLGPVVWGPLVEEAVKALGLVLIVAFGPEPLRSVRSGIARGALVGLGFASAENIPSHLLAVVQGGTGGLARAVFVRGVLQGLNHATFTGTVGAGLALAKDSRPGAARAAAPALGFLIALAQHGLWNALASTTITRLLCGQATAAGACQATPPAEALYFQVPLLVALFIGPGLAALGWLARKPGPTGQRSLGNGNQGKKRK